ASGPRPGPSAAILEQVGARPDTPTESLTLLPAERAGDAVPDAVPSPEFADTIHGLFERRAALDPERIALEGQETVTYADLNARANRLARVLLDRGVRPGETVGVCTGRGVDLVVAFLAVLKAGAVYLPLDPDYPPARLSFMLSDSGAPLAREREGALGGVPCPTVLDLATLETTRQSSDNLDAGTHRLAPAYLIYTSGSTGEPKGVLLQHAGVCHVADAQLRHFALTPQERILQFSSPNFDASVFELVMAARCGGTLCLAGVDQLTPGPPLFNLLQRRGITVLTIPPSSLAALSALA